MKKIILSLTLSLITTIIVPCENPNPYTIQVLTKNELHPLFPFVAQARIDIFRNYPYLYDGNIEEEMDDLQKYAEHPHSALAIAYHNDQPVGFLCGSDLMNYNVHFDTPLADLFESAGLNPEKQYYFADVIILPEHRGNHLTPQLFAALEKHAQNRGYTSSCFITEHHENHPLKPKNHRSLVGLWNKLNYRKSELIVHSTWQTHQVDGTTQRERHPLVFWLKDLK